MRKHTLDPQAATCRLEISYRELTENPESLSTICGMIANTRAKLGNDCPDIIVSIVPEAAKPAPWTANDQARFERDFKLFQRWASGEAAPDEVLPWQTPPEALRGIDPDPAAVTEQQEQRARKSAFFQKHPELENYVPPLYRAINEGLELIRDLQLAPANEIPQDLTDVQAANELFQRALLFANSKNPQAEDDYTLNLPLLAACKRLEEISNLLRAECAKNHPFARQIEEFMKDWRGFG